MILSFVYAEALVVVQCSRSSPSLTQGYSFSYKCYTDSGLCSYHTNYVILFLSHINTKTQQ